MTTRFITPIGITTILLTLLTGWVAALIGCGGTNPVVTEAIQLRDRTSQLDIEIEVSSPTVRSGSEVRLSVKVTSQPSATEQLLFLWKIMSGGGSFSTPPNQSRVIWHAPTVNSGKAQHLGVIRVTVTSISPQSNGDSNGDVKTAKSLTSATKVIPITVIGAYYDM